MFCAWRWCLIWGGCPLPAGPRHKAPARHHLAGRAMPGGRAVPGAPVPAARGQAGEHSKHPCTCLLFQAQPQALHCGERGSRVEHLNCTKRDRSWLAARCTCPPALHVYQPNFCPLWTMAALLLQPLCLLTSSRDTRPAPARCCEVRRRVGAADRAPWPGTTAACPPTVQRGAWQQLAAALMWHQVSRPSAAGCAGCRGHQGAGTPV